MQFNRGMVGVLIVVLSLIASAGLGVITNIETKTVTKNVDEYVADITGAFESDKEQSYTDYNPSSNYNGYTNNTISNNYAVEYTPSDYTNNYPLTYASSQTSSTFTTPNNFTSTKTTIQTNYSINYPGYENHQRYRDLTTSPYAPGYHVIYQYIPGPYTANNISGSGSTTYISLNSILQECRTEGTSLLGVTPDNITITIPSTVMKQDISYIPLEGYSSTYAAAPVYYLSNNVFVVPTSGITTPQPNASYISNCILNTYSTASLINVGSGNAYDITILYSIANNTIDVLVNDSPIITGVSPQSYSLIYGVPGYWRQNFEYQDGSEVSHQTQDGMANFSTVPVTELSVKYVLETHTDHIDTRYGIGIRNGQDVTWSNKQQNGVTSLTFSTWTGIDPTPFDDSGLAYSNTAVLKYTGTTDTDTFTISRSGGITSISLNGGLPISIGTWKQIEVTLDNINGIMSASPIGTWDNFNNYSLAGTTVEIGPLKQNNLSAIDWTANNSFRLQVTNTEVFFNNYGVVMIDPHITISDLWPNYNLFMLDMSKVATVGTTITIGNVTYPIISNILNTTSIEGGETIYTPTGIDVTDMQLHYTKTDGGWNVNVISGKNELSLNVPTTYIGMVGTWYFTMGFYQTVSRDVQERSWDPTTYDWYASHLFFWMAGILLLFSILAYKMGYLDGLSILILIVTEVILIIIGGTT